MTGEFTPQQEIMLQNLSQFGAGATASQDLPDIGEHVRIALASGDALCGHVRWSDGDAFGLRLDAPFDLRRLQQINYLRQRLHGAENAVAQSPVSQSPVSQ